jgi:7-cyano-7-deazaguanine reductase
MPSNKPAPLLATRDRKASSRAGGRPAAPGHTRPSRELDVFPNPSPKRDFLVHIEVPEFTCVCPLTGQPDFATIVLDYIPEQHCVELKSLKLYMWSFRDQGAFHEAVTNQILDDLVGVLKPRFARVTAKWYVRGGIFTNVIAEHRARSFKPLATLDLSAYGAVAGARSTA